MIAKGIFHIMAVALLLTARSASAEPITFDFKDGKGVNTMSILLDSEIEPIMGMAQGITGTVLFDPEAPKLVSGEIAVAAKEIGMANATMTKYLHTDEWIDVESFPFVSFKMNDIHGMKKADDGMYEAEISGDFTLKGKTMPLTTTVSLDYKPDKVKARFGKGEGDLLVLRTEFSINRTDFGIKPDTGPEKVADRIRIHVAIVGTAMR